MIFGWQVGYFAIQIFQCCLVKEYLVGDLKLKLFACIHIKFKIILIGGNLNAILHSWEKKVVD
jgi:hypothetical protein